jgi:peptidoglycan/LPS O-acetylase OafA/YrhL
MALGNAYMAVDTFFLVGGFLLSYGFFREMQRGNPFDAIKFYLYRYIRFKLL